MRLKVIGVTAALLAAALLAGTAASAQTRADKPQTRHIEKEGFRIDLPKGWGELPDAANTAANAILGASTQYTGGALAAGDPSQGVMVVVFWLRATDKSTSVRAALEDYHRGIKDALDEGGVKLGKWELGETATQLKVDGEGTEGDVVLRLVSIATVGKDDRLAAWTAECIHGADAKKGAALCADALASFGITAADADLKPLEKKKATKK